MKHQASQLSLILAALAFAPAALAGSEIVKCIDSAGQVTLTDQPCNGNTKTVHLAQVPSAAPVAMPLQAEPETDAGAGNFADVAAGVQASPIERHRATRGLLRQASWTPPPPPRSRPLARDVATLKEARLQLLMLDSAGKRQPRLAGLH